MNATKESLLVSFCILVLALMPLCASAQTGVQYIYDDLGRLVGVIDPSGNAAGYSYDAVGNLLSITRYTSSQVSILNFTPQAGPVGTTVTIAGTGFSATSSQDTVSFNATNATIASATVNQLVVTVPSGATTGPIQVTTPLGTFTSSTNFTVTTGSGQPSITSFTPTTATTGTSITITGTNFDSSPVNDRLGFNTTQQFVGSATTTTLTTTVPGATTSGRLTLATAGGTTQSTQDLFIPFGSHVAADVGFSGRTTMGGAQTIALSGANKIGLLIFDAVAGQRLSVQMSGSTFSACTLYLYSPTGGTQLAQSGCTSGFTFLDGTVLPVNGTYTLGLEPQGTTGSITVTLNNVSDVKGTIALGGSPVTVTTTTAGQNASLTFPATAGQRASMNLTTGSYSSCNLTLLNPGLTSLTTGSCGGASNFIDTANLAFTGTYTISIDPQTTGTGHVTVQLNNATDVTGTIVPGGSAVTATTTVRGQDARLTFSGTANQRVSVLVNSVTNPSATLSLLKPDGTTQSSMAISTGCNCFMDVQTLVTTGTYTIWVQHSNQNIGSETVTLYNVPADVTGTLTIGGSAFTVTTTTPGQNAALTFSGTAGQKTSFNFTSSTFGSFACTAKITNPDGTTFVTSNYYCSGANYIDVMTLGQTGTYTIFIDPQGTATGNVTVQTYNDTDVTGTITPGGTSVAETTVSGQDIRLTFSGTATQRVSLFVNNVTNPAATVWLVKPDGTNQASISISSGQTSFMDVQTLATTGTYTLWMQHSGSRSGNETFQLYNVPADSSGVLTVGGAAVAETTNTPGQNANLAFSGTSGQHVTMHLTSGSYNSCIMKLLNPDGSTLASNISCSGTSNTNGPYTLGATGTFTIFIDPQGTATGGITMQLTAQ